MATEILYLGHNNWISMQLKSDNIALTNTQMDAITKISITIGSVTVTTVAADKATGSIRWRQTGYDTGEVRFYLGAQSTIAACSAAQPAWVVIYDATHTEGLVWGYLNVIVQSNMEDTGP